MFLPSRKCFFIILLVICFGLTFPLTIDLQVDPSISYNSILEHFDNLSFDSTEITLCDSSLDCSLLNIFSSFFNFNR